jgi:hypothetical protein
MVKRLKLQRLFNIAHLPRSKGDRRVVHIQAGGMSPVDLSPDDLMALLAYLNSFKERNYLTVTGCRLVLDSRMQLIGMALVIVRDTGGNRMKVGEYACRFSAGR